MVLRRAYEEKGINFLDSEKVRNLLISEKTVSVLIITLFCGAVK
jgi:hypothetical protein